MPDDIEGDPGVPGGPGLQPGSGVESGSHSSSAQNAPANHQISQIDGPRNLEQNEQSGLGQSARQPSHAESQEHIQHIALQNDASEEPRSKAKKNGDDDAMSDGSSDSGLFVEQDVEIKSEDESDNRREKERPGDEDENVDEDDDHSDNENDDEDGSDDDDKDGSGDDDQSHDEDEDHDTEEHHGGPESRADEDDDDECMVIDAQDIPDDIKAKFAEYKSAFPEAAAPDLVCTGSVQIKKEHDDDDIIVLSDSENDLDFRVDEDDVLSDGERPRERRRRASKPRKKQKASSGRATGIDVAAAEGGAWHEPTEEELLDLCTKQEELNALKAQGSLTLAQKLALAKITARISAVEKAVQKLAGSTSSVGQLVAGDDQEDDVEVEEQLNRALASARQGWPRSSAPRKTATPACAPGEGTVEAPQQERSAITKTMKPTRPAPKTAREYWERQYAEKGSGLRNMTENPRKRKRPQNGSGRRKAGKKGDSRESKLMRMLKDSNPIMARAAQGAMAMPGPIQATTRDNQLKAMKNFLFKISGNPNPRSRPVDMKILKDAIKSFGFRGVRTVDDRWKLKGMKSTLYNHQLVGVSWMLCQEFSPDGPYGGILADQMGLGKTVQVLAAMAVNQPSPEDIEAGRHQTLIIAPARVIDQWKREIERHCEPSLFKRVLHYKSSHKLDASMWQAADIILASYHEVANAYPSEKSLREIAGRKLNDEEWAEEFEAELGELFGHTFFRVVLDEGHSIRNANRKTAKACINLTSKYRWILTGTPLHNSVEEFYPYFRFLGAHWAEDHDQFSKQFGNIEKDDSQARLAAVITSIMLRRRVEDRFLGVPILQIPQTHPTEIIWVDLTTEERLCYRRLESRFRDNMSTHIQKGIAHQKLTTYLAYLTRLRQAVAHPFLLEDVLKKNFTLEDFHYLRRQLARLGGKKPMHLQLQHWVKLVYEASVGGDGDNTKFGNSRFGCEFNVDAELEEMAAHKSIDDVICRLCYEPADNPKITECGHTFCQECIEWALKLEPSCPTCKAMLFQIDALRQPENLLEESDDDEGHGKRSRRKKKKKKGKREVGDDENWAQPKLRDSSKWIEQYDRNYPNKDLMAGAKTIAVKNQILIWQRQAPDDKIIVFVNWAKLACIIGRMLFEEGIPFLYYFGDLTPEEKAAAIPDFQVNPEIKVMIASIRCGGQGLNLTCANRVILVDQWWNTAMEQQAFGRVHRIGQEKETYFVKILTKDTIDERLMEMGQDKEQLISKALQEDAAHKTAPTLEELLRLFQVGDPAAAEDDDEAVTEGGAIELSDDEHGDEGKGQGESQATETGDGDE